jgi:hypothetical protein
MLLPPASVYGMKSSMISKGKDNFNRQHGINYVQVRAFRETPITNSTMPFTASKTGPLSPENAEIEK